MTYNYSKSVGPEHDYENSRVLSYDKNSNLAFQHNVKDGVYFISGYEDGEYIIPCGQNFLKAKERFLKETGKEMTNTIQVDLSDRSQLQNVNTTITNDDFIVFTVKHHEALVLFNLFQECGVKFNSKMVGEWLNKRNYTITVENTDYYKGFIDAYDFGIYDHTQPITNTTVLVQYAVTEKQS